jgi:DNA-binding transcriptional LysR family regulator
MDRFQAMSTFLAVVDAGGFAAAGRRLGLSPSAVTRAVAQLEDRLETRLLQRTTRSLRLTDAGQRFHDRARRILADLDDAWVRTRDDRGRPVGRLALSAPVMFGKLHVGPLLCRFMNAHPGLEADLTLSDRNVDLVEDGIDLAVRIGQLEDSTAVARQVGITRRVAVAAPGYLAAAGTPRTPDDLARHRLIAGADLAGRRRWRFGGGPRPEREVAVAPAYATNLIEPALWHAEHGGGVTLALAYQVEEAVRTGRLVVVLADHEPPPAPIHCVYPSSRLLSAKVRGFIDMIVASCDWRFVDL